MKTAIALCFVAALVSAGSLPAAAADPHPDFSGIWTIYRDPNGGGGGFGPRALPEGVTLKPEAQAKVDEYRKLVAPKGESPGGWCLGTGMPGSMLGAGAYPMEIIQRPEQITVIYEAHTELRRIYIEGESPHDDVPPGDLFPTRNGYSVGRWEGDTLVVETTSLKEQVDQAMAHSANAHITERYTLGTDANGTKVLTAEMTMTDPDFYNKPVTATKKWAPLEGGRMLFYECNEPAWEEHLDNLREQMSD